MRVTRLLLAASAAALLATPAAAQDRLFVSVAGESQSRAVEVGAIRSFGQPLGPVPAEVSARPLPRVEHFSVSATTVVDRQTSAVIHEVPQGATISGWAATEDATRVFVASFGPGFEWRLQAIDVATRAVAAETTPGTSVGPLTWVPGDRIVAGTSSSNHLLFDRDLRPLGEFSLGSSCQPRWMVSPHTGRVYVLAVGGYNQSFLFASLYGFDALAAVRVGAVDLNSSLGVGRLTSCDSAGATLWTAPGRPQRFAASVVGREARLSWLPTDYAEGYVLDVGLAPGRTDAAIYLGTNTNVIFADPQSGTFYLRVRAGNRMGGGRPSQEVRVVVP